MTALHSVVKKSPEKRASEEFCEAPTPMRDRQLVVDVEKEACDRLARLTMEDTEPSGEGGPEEETLSPWGRVISRLAIPDPAETVATELEAANADTGRPGDSGSSEADGETSEGGPGTPVQEGVHSPWADAAMLLLGKSAKESPKAEPRQARDWAAAALGLMSQSAPRAHKFGAGEVVLSGSPRAPTPQRLRAALHARPALFSARAAQKPPIRSRSRPRCRAIGGSPNQRPPPFPRSGSSSSSSGGGFGETAGPPKDGSSGAVSLPRTDTFSSVDTRDTRLSMSTGVSGSTAGTGGSMVRNDSIMSAPTKSEISLTMRSHSVSSEPGLDLGLPTRDRSLLRSDSLPSTGESLPRTDGGSEPARSDISASRSDSLPRTDSGGSMLSVPRTDGAESVLSVPRTDGGGSVARSDISALSVPRTESGESVLSVPRTDGGGSVARSDISALSVPRTESGESVLSVPRTDGGGSLARSDSLSTTGESVPRTDDSSPAPSDSSHCSASTAISVPRTDEGSLPCQEEPELPPAVHVPSQHDLDAVPCTADDGADDCQVVVQSSDYGELVSESGSSISPLSLDRNALEMHESSVMSSRGGSSSEEEDEEGETTFVTAQSSDDEAALSVAQYAGDVVTKDDLAR